MNEKKKKKQKKLKKRYAWDVTNMLKQVCNVGVAIDGINTNVKEQLRRKSRNCTQRKHTTYVKRIKTQESIIMWKNQYELKKER